MSSCCEHAQRSARGPSWDCQLRRGKPRFDGIARHRRHWRFTGSAERRWRPRWQDCGGVSSCRRPSIDRSPVMHGWRGGLRAWCRSTNTTRRGSSAPTARPPTSLRAAAQRLRPPVRALQDALCRNHPAHRRSGRKHLRPAIHRRLPGAVPVSAATCATTCRRPPSCNRATGVTVTDLDGNRFYDVSGSYGVNVFGYDFYKECHRARRCAGARARPGARPLSSGDRRERRDCSRRSPAWTRSRSTCRAPKR